MSAIKYPHIVVIGRIPEDDEDSIYVYENLTETEAREEFEKTLYADDWGDKTPSSVEADWGVSCYINAVLTSDTPINILSFNY